MTRRFARFFRQAVLLVCLLTPAIGAGQDTRPSSSAEWYLANSSADLPAYLAHSSIAIQPYPRKSLEYLVTSQMIKSAAEQANGDYSRIPKRTYKQIAKNALILRDHLDIYSRENPNYTWSDGGKKFWIYAAQGIGGLVPFVGSLTGAGAGWVTDVGVHRLERGSIEIARSDAVIRYGQSAAYPITESAANNFVNCRRISACAQMLDGLFRDYYGGIGIGVTGWERISQVQTLGNTERIAGIGRELERLRGQVNQLNDDDSSADPGVFARNFEEYWTSVTGLATDEYLSYQGSSSDEGTSPLPFSDWSKQDIANLAAGFDIAYSVAFIAGDYRTAEAAATLGSSVVKMAEVFSDESSSDLMITAASGNFVVAAIQVVGILSSSGPSDTEVILAALNAISEQIQSVHKDLTRGFATTNARLLVYTNQLQYGIDTLSANLELVRDNVNWLSESQYKNELTRARIQVQAEKSRIGKWINRCISDDTTKLNSLGPLLFEQCENAFYAFATTEARYGDKLIPRLPIMTTSSTDLDSFVAHAYLPNLYHLANIDEHIIWESVDPRYWENGADSLIRLYQQNPTLNPQESMRRGQKLAYVRDVGREAEAIFREIAQVSSNVNGVWLGKLLDRSLAEYELSLNRVVDKIEEVVDVGDPHGNKAVQRLDSKPSAGQRYAAMEAILSGSEVEIPIISSCEFSEDKSFALDDSDLTLAGIYENNVQPFWNDRSLWRVGWSRKAVDSRKFGSPQFVELSPGRVIWARLAGLGDLSLCLEEYRPTMVHFKDSRYSKWNYKADYLIEGTVAVVFTPNESFAGLDDSIVKDENIVVARWTGAVDCKNKAYRRETSGYDGQRRLTSVMKNGHFSWERSVGDCTNSPMKKSLAAVPVESEESESLFAAIESVYGEQAEKVRTALLSSIASSSELRRAREIYARHLVLQSLTVGIIDQTSKETPSKTYVPLISPSTALSRILTADDYSTLRAKIGDGILDHHNYVNRVLESDSPIPEIEETLNWNRFNGMLSRLDTAIALLVAVSGSAEN